MTTPDTRAQLDAFQRLAARGKAQSMQGLRALCEKIAAAQDEDERYPEADMNLDLAQELCDHAAEIIAMVDEISHAAPMIAAAVSVAHADDATRQELRAAAQTAGAPPGPAAEAIANADAHLNNAALPLYSRVIEERADLLAVAEALALATDEGDDRAQGTHYVDPSGTIRCKGSFLAAIERARAAVARVTGGAA